MTVDKLQCHACGTIQPADAMMKFMDDGVEHYVCVNYTRCQQNVNAKVAEADAESTDAVAHERLRTAIGRLRSLLGDLEYVDAHLSKSIMERMDRSEEQRATEIQEGDFANMVGRLEKMERALLDLRGQQLPPAGFAPKGRRHVPLEWSGVDR